MQRMIPKAIGRYKVKAKIAEGGMATIFRAHDPRFKRDVAIKMLPREFLHDRTFRTRFEREAEIIASLEHPTIVPVYDYGEEDGQPYFVMRYMPGGSLAERILEMPLPVAEAARILARLAPGLDAAHAKSIIHRDLKPANILFDQYDEPYTSDFGIVKIVEAGTTLTGQAMTIGTPDYMSPEQASGEMLDGRSDVYSLGIVLFEMLTGSLPYVADTPLGLAYKHVNEPLPHVLDKMPTLPPGCQKVIEKATAKRKEDRYPNVAAMAAALSAVAQSVAAPPKSTTGIFAPVKSSKSKAGDKRAKAKATPGRKPKTVLDKSALAGAVSKKPAPAKPRDVNTEAPTVRLGPDQSTPPLLRLRGAIQSVIPHLRRPIGIVVLIGVLALCLLAGAAVAVRFAATAAKGAPTPSPISKAVAVVNVDNAHVRAGPGLSFDEVAIVHKSDRLEVRGRNEDSKWVAVTLPNQDQGWITASAVNVSVDNVSVDIPSLEAIRVPPPP